MDMTTKDIPPIDDCIEIQVKSGETLASGPSGYVFGCQMQNLYLNHWQMEIVRMLHTELL